MSFKEKVILITGASSGIGESVSQVFSKEGGNVVLVGRNEEKLWKVAEKCESYGSKTLVITADLTKDEDLKKIIQNTLKDFGKIHVLVNNAGIAGMESIISETAMQMFDKMIATNLRPAVYLTHLCVPYLIETKGNIINIGSIAACAPLFCENFSYSTSKAALDNFTKCIAFELAPKGVRANTVNPGPVKTNFMDAMNIDKNSQEDLWQVLIKGSALGKAIDPEEIAALVIFLASDKAKSITGVSYVIDNGVLLKGFMKETDN
ncbi:hypothetical protein K1T71_009805 [Dendrolimus kikuchii]|uniref:Uncharacterized protein n=1 Tax=Dendrolimus kikuchii TaxID=765133 RepID=A0ACC1CTT4_9NEOP|nr:hypothetical protein K1T71_009805 [Dendrolimus kikuchii]